MSDVKELRKCSDCRCTMLLKYFSENKKGDLYKCCDGCRAKRTAKRNTPEGKLKEKERKAKFYKEDKTLISNRVKLYRESNPEKYKSTKKKYKPKQRTRQKERRKNDPNFRLRCNLATRLSNIVNQKSAHTMELVGCTLEQLKEHLQNKFEEGMTWENYGKWHIDHIKPCASFDLTSPVEQRTCFNWVNLQPLWAKDNLSKGDKLDWVK